MGYNPANFAYAIGTDPWVGRLAVSFAISFCDARTGRESARGPRLLVPYPNPANSAVVLAYETDGTVPAVLSVHDLLGQVVWRYRGAAGEPGTRRVIWPSTTADGRPAATGIYLVRLESGDRSGCVRLALIR